MRSFDIRRQLSQSERTEVDQLLTDAWRADGTRPMSDHMWLDLREGGRRGYAGIIARDTDHNHIIGYCQVSRGNDSWGIDLIVHPHHRYDMTEIGPRLLSEAVSVVAADGGGHVHWWVFEANNAHAVLAERSGFKPGRRLVQLRRPLPLERVHLDLLEGFETTSFRVGTDETEWLEVNNAAFATHPEQGGWTIDTITSRQGETWFNAEGFRIHRENDTINGFCWTKVHDDDNGTLGEIYAVGVNPAVSSRGIGRRLVVDGLRHLASIGATTAMLYVDADNEPAMNVYAILGFTPHHSELAFVGDVEGSR